MEKIIIPDHLYHASFFDDSAIVISPRTPFFDEILYLNGKADSPLEKASQRMQEYFADFHNESEMIKSHFKCRKGEKARLHVLFHLSRLVTMLFWNENLLCPPLDEMETRVARLKSKPLNAAERILFIMKAPGQFQSFIQLQELFLEFEKKAAAKPFLIKGEE
ncbi:YpoC family protein [Fictibacillus iocasae]|uniref:YpoC family protein n=1 Tax=Fictibacillus iocasae TaxID=2715437 RepID=A0ABW2NLS0_9BACL